MAIKGVVEIREVESRHGKGEKGRRLYQAHGRHVVEVVVSVAEVDDTIEERSNAGEEVVVVLSMAKTCDVAVADVEFVHPFLSQHWTMYSRCFIVLMVV